MSTATPVASSAGVDDTRIGAPGSADVKFKLVWLVIPAYGLPAWSVNAPAEMSTQKSTLEASCPAGLMVTVVPSVVTRPLVTGMLRDR